MEYIQKPKTVRAIQYDGCNKAEIEKAFGAHFGEYTEPTGRFIAVKTQYGNMYAHIGDFVVCDDEGNVYPCMKEPFLAAYLAPTAKTMALWDKEIARLLKEAYATAKHYANPLNNDATGSNICTTVVHDLEGLSGLLGEIDHMGKELWRGITKAD